MPVAVAFAAVTFVSAGTTAAGGANGDSYAPMSGSPPTTRGNPTPRSSVAGGTPATSVPALMAGEPSRRATVGWWTVPPAPAGFSWSGPRFRAVPNGRLWWLMLVQSPTSTVPPGSTPTALN